MNENIIEASWQALLDSIHFGLLRAAGPSASSKFIRCLPIRSCRRSSPTGRASSRTCRPAWRRRPRATGVPIVPATSGGASAEGALLGRPGPNVGYAYTLAAAGRRSACACRRSSTTHDAIAVIAEIAGKRAAQFGRAPVMGDIDVAIALLGYDGLVDDEFVDAARPASCTTPRTTTSAGASSSTRFPTRCCRCGCRS